MGISFQTEMLEIYDKFSKLTLGFIGCNPFFNMYWFSCFYEVPSIQVLRTVNSVIKVFFFSRVLIKAFVVYLYACHLGLRSNKAILLAWMEIYAMTHFTMTCSPVGLISLMDWALCPVIAMVKVRFPVKPGFFQVLFQPLRLFIQLRESFPLPKLLLLFWQTKQF